jgi:hypothetical protein
MQKTITKSMYERIRAVVTNLEAQYQVKVDDRQQHLYITENVITSTIIKEVEKEGLKLICVIPDYKQDTCTAIFEYGDAQ